MGRESTLCMREVALVQLAHADVNISLKRHRQLKIRFCVAWSRTGCPCDCMCMVQGEPSLFAGPLWSFWLLRQLTQAPSVLLTSCASATGASAKAANSTWCSISVDLVWLVRVAAFSEAPIEEQCKLLRHLWQVY